MTNIFELESPFIEYENSRIVVVPVPWEPTVSWEGGTGQGPQAILDASCYVEVWDEETKLEPYRLGVHTADPVELSGGPESIPEGLERLGAVCERLYRDDKKPLVLGGEHSLSYAPALAAKRAFGDVAVVQFDAHTDLRAEYHDTPWSHACVIRRLLEAEVSTLAVGIRAVSPDEAELITERRLPIVWAEELDRLEPSRWESLLDALPERVYVTFDLDYFDPSLLPATGTPEPGGGFWWPTLRLLREVFRRKTVVGMDIVELAPREGMHASDFVAAKLAYKACAYWQESG